MVANQVRSLPESRKYTSEGQGHGNSGGGLAKTNYNCILIVARNEYSGVIVLDTLFFANHYFWVPKMPRGSAKDSGSR